MSTRSISKLSNSAELKKEVKAQASDDAQRVAFDNLLRLAMCTEVKEDHPPDSSAGVGSGLYQQAMSPNSSSSTVPVSPEESPHRTPSPSWPSTEPASPSRGDEITAPKVFNTIFPRRKAGQHTRVNSKPVVLNEKTLQQFFTLPLHEAAVKLGISATAMKSACRKLGIKKWPYRSVQSKQSTNRSTPKACRTSSKAACMVDDQTFKDAELLAETLKLLQQSGNPEDQGNNSSVANLLN